MSDIQPKQVVVCGYATLDYVVHLSEPFHGTGTVMGELGVSGAWPRAGGAALYASRRIASAGHRSFALTWIGDDGDGGHYLRACLRAKICCDAIDQRRAAETPRCILLYHPAGDYGCLLDADFGVAASLTGTQTQVIRGADHLCISAGPARATAEALNHCSAECTVSWIAKLDRASFPPDLCIELARRAKLIFCNASEREFIEESFGGKRPEGQIIIETLGSAGVLIDCPEGKRVIAASPITTYDTTGAGDTLAGEVIAHFLSGHVTIDEAVERGMNAARDLLASRPGWRVPELR